MKVLHAIAIVAAATVMGYIAGMWFLNAPPTVEISAPRGVVPPVMETSPPPEPPRRIDTTFYSLAIEGIEAPFVAGATGSLARLGDRLALLTGDGRLHLLRGDRSGFDTLDIPPPFDREELKALYVRPKDKDDTGAEGFVTRPTDFGWEIFAAHARAHSDESCITLAVSRLSLRDDGDALTLRDPWKQIYETSPCLAAPEAFPHQSGGMLVFGPDGNLLLAVGDHGYDDLSRTNPKIKPAEPGNDYGKIVAIDPETGDHRVIAMGLRNSSGMTVDDLGRVWEVEHGPRGGDELNLIEMGRNFGWPLVTYGAHYGAHAWPANPAQGRHLGYDRPVFSWVPSIAVSGLIQIGGDMFPAWRGDLLAGSLKDQTLFRMRIGEGPRVVFAEPVNIGVRIRSLAQLASGEIAIMPDERPYLMLLRPVQSQEAPSQILAPCAECHSLEPGGAGAKTAGLWGVWERDIASAPSVDYSEGLRSISGKWTRNNLANYLAAPGRFAHGTTMPAPGIGPDGLSRILDELERLGPGQ